MSTKTQTEWIIQGNYGYGDGWEDLSAYDSPYAAEEDLRLYRENEPEYAHRLIRRRVKTSDES